MVPAGCLLDLPQRPPVHVAEVVLSEVREGEAVPQVREVVVEERSMRPVVVVEVEVVVKVDLSEEVRWVVAADLLLESPSHSLHPSASRVRPLSTWRRRNGQQGGVHRKYQIPHHYQRDQREDLRRRRRQQSTLHTTLDSRSQTPCRCLSSLGRRRRRSSSTGTCRSTVNKCRASTHTTNSTCRRMAIKHTPTQAVPSIRDSWDLNRRHQVNIWDSIRRHRHSSR